MSGTAEVRIVLEAIPFCYGPAAHAIAIARQFKAAFNYSKVHITAISDNPVLELIKSSDVINKTIQYCPERFLSPPSYIVSEIRKADILVCIGDFTFVSITKPYTSKIYFVDPLLWMWDKVPNELNDCHMYFTTMFSGVQERAHSINRKLKSGTKVIVTEQICDSIGCFKKRAKGKILVNYGGIVNPFGWNKRLVTAMTEEIVNAARGSRCVQEVIFCGGSAAINEIRGSLSDCDLDLRYESLPQKEFFNEMNSSEALLTVPGMSIVYEAIASKTPTFFLLPLNYSQHRQYAFYKRHLKNIDSITWDDFSDYHTLPEALPEDEAIKIAHKFGRSFAKDMNSRTLFRTCIFDYFKKENKKHLNVYENQHARLYNMNGAKQIVEYVLADNNKIKWSRLNLTLADIDYVNRRAPQNESVAKVELCSSKQTKMKEA